MSDSAEQYRNLVDRLLLRTQKGKLPWSIGWGNRLECEFQAYTIRLESGETAEGEPLEFILLLKDDEIIDQFNDAEISDDDWQPNQYWIKMKDLRKLANRQARGVDVAVKDILDQLSDDESE